MTYQPLKETAKSLFLNALRGAGDRPVIALDYLRVFGRFPHLGNPQTFNEHLQASKLTDRDWRLPILVDKLLVKNHVARVLGAEWVTPTLWSGKRVTGALLSGVGKPAVLKCNHASGKVLFLEDDSDFDALARKANAWLSYDYHLLHREWAYAHVARRLLIEPRIADREELTDYKFWCVGGEVCLVQVDLGRFTHHTRQFYDPDWVRLDLSMNYPGGESAVPRPRALDVMLDAARALARSHRFVRVDLYNCAEGPKFGEMTFWPEAGLCRWRPASFDAELGALLERSSHASPPARLDVAALGREGARQQTDTTLC